MKKSIIAIAIIMLVTSFSSVFAKSFSDVKSGMWAYDAIKRWSDEGIIVGYEEGDYRPNNFITRAEFACIVVGLFEPEAQADLSKYTDVSADAWYYKTLAKAVKMGAIEESTATKMTPNSYVTRQEAVVILNAVLGLERVSDYKFIKEFEDYEEISDYAVKDVEIFTERGYVIGYPDKTFKPSNMITRAEAASILDRIIYAIVKEDGATLDLKGTSSTVIIKAKNVTIKNLESSNIVFLNDEVKASTKGLTDAQKNKFIVINKGSGSSSKSTGRSSGSTTSTSSVASFTVKVNGDKYAVARSGALVKNDRTIRVYVGVDNRVVNKKLSADNVMEILETVVNAMDNTDYIINTIEANTYGHADQFKDWGRMTILQMIVDGTLELDDGKANNVAKAELNADHPDWDILAIYNDLTADSKAQVKPTAMKVLKQAYEDGTITYQDIITMLNELPK